MKKNIFRASILACIFVACQPNDVNAMEDIRRWLGTAMAKVGSWFRTKQQISDSAHNVHIQQITNEEYQQKINEFELQKQQQEESRQRDRLQQELNASPYEMLYPQEHEYNPNIPQQVIPYNPNQPHNIYPEDVVPYNPDNPPFNPHHFEEQDIIPYNPHNPPSFNPELMQGNEHIDNEIVHLERLYLNHHEINDLIHHLGLNEFKDDLDASACSAQEAQRRFREAYSMVKGENRFLSEEVMIDALLQSIKLSTRDIQNIIEKLGLTLYQDEIDQDLGTAHDVRERLKPAFALAHERQGDLSQDIMLNAVIAVRQRN